MTERGSGRGVQVQDPPELRYELSQHLLSAPVLMMDEAPDHPQTAGYHLVEVSTALLANPLRRLLHPDGRRHDPTRHTFPSVRRRSYTTCDDLVVRALEGRADPLSHRRGGVRRRRNRDASRPRPARANPAHRIRTGSAPRLLLAEFGDAAPRRRVEHPGRRYSGIGYDSTAARPTRGASTAPRQVERGIVDTP